MLSINVVAKSLTIYSCEFIDRKFLTSFETYICTVHVCIICMYMHFNKTVLRIYIRVFKWILIEFLQTCIEESIRE